MGAGQGRTLVSAPEAGVISPTATRAEIEAHLREIKAREEEKKRALRAKRRCKTCGEAGHWKGERACPARDNP